MASDEEFRMITALKQRDCSAWSAAVDHHLHEVYGFVFHLVGGDRAEAEDLTQETWLKALDSIRQCDALRGSFRNWLFGIARKQVALHYRRRVVARNSPSLTGDPFEETVESRDISVLPKDVLEQVERAAVVRAALLLLPDDRRAVLLGKYVEGLSVELVAIRMGRTAKANESLLSRAREQLRGLLGGYITPCGDGHPETGKQGVVP